MESEVEADTKAARGWGWASFFVVLGFICITDTLRGPDGDPNRVLMGAGFLLCVPKAFLHPLRFNEITFKGSLSTPLDWMALLGAILCTIGFMGRWL